MDLPAEDLFGIVRNLTDATPAPHQTRALARSRSCRVARAGQKRSDPSEVSLRRGRLRRRRPTFPLSSIIGGQGLTAVFGMGTGVTPDLWSPTNRRGPCPCRDGEFGFGRGEPGRSAAADQNQEYQGDDRDRRGLTVLRRGPRRGAASGWSDQAFDR